MQRFRGDPMSSTVSAIAWSWPVSMLCVILMGLKVVGVSIVLMWGLGLCGPNAGGEDGCMQSDGSLCVMRPLFLLNKWRGESSVCSVVKETSIYTENDKNIL